jgi:hypothetical protein
MRRAIAASVVALGSVAACGDDAPDPVTEAETGVAAVIADRLEAGAGDVVVSCPDELDIVAGAAFTCAVAVGGAASVDVPLAVAADGTIELRRAVVPTAAAESYLAAELAGAAEGPVEPDCGEAPLLVADVGEELRCEVVRTSDGAVRPVVVTVLALDGTVRYRVEPPATVPGSTSTTSTTSPP